MNGLACLAENLTGVLLPQYANIVRNLAFALQIGEVAIMLWLIVMGAKDRSIMTPIKSS